MTKVEGTVKTPPLAQIYSFVRNILHVNNVKTVHYFQISDLDRYNTGLQEEQIAIRGK